MWLIMLFVGFLVGVIAGLVWFAWATLETEKKAVADGVIKLDGKVFVLKEIDL